MGRSDRGALDTTEAADQLGITRQALYKRVKAGTLLGVPGRGTTYFPTWQFDHNLQPRKAIRDVIGAFRDAGVDDPLVVPSWAAKEQPELEGPGLHYSPKDWIARGGKEEPLLLSARRTAATLSQRVPGAPCPGPPTTRRSSPGSLRSTNPTSPSSPIASTGSTPKRRGSPPAVATTPGASTHHPDPPWATEPATCRSTLSVPTSRPWVGWR